MSIIRNFYQYQKERFPIVILAISLLPAILSSYAVLFSHASYFTLVKTLIIALLYLLHIRVIDEQRDLLHDKKHHPSRPIPAGTISLRELQIIDMISVSLFVIIALSSGIVVLVVALVMLSYSFMAQHEFFLKSYFKKHFFMYNVSNLLQMILMQVLVYLLLSPVIFMDSLLLFHFLFTSLGTIIFEFLRKIKIPGKDGSGEDTYSWHLGFTNVLFIYCSLAAVNLLLFLFLIIRFSSMLPWLVVSSILFIYVTLNTLLHYKKQTLLTERLLQLSFIIVYATCNVLLYINLS